MVAAGEVGDHPVPEPGLRVSRGSSSTWEVVTVSGDLDLTGVGELERTLGEVLDVAAGGLLLDLSGVTFLGSEGVRAMLRARDRAEADGRAWKVLAGEGPPGG